jgi:hypothetical protein
MHVCWLAALLPLVVLLGCTPGIQAAGESIVHMFKPSARGQESALDPNFSYLRVTRGRHTGLLWRGSIERSPDGPIEVYYSGTGEVLRLQNGRVVSALGLTTEWRRVELAGAPTWAALAEASGPISFQRFRDVMPGYRANLRDDLTIRAIPPPSSSGLLGAEPRELRWFEERSAGSTLVQRLSAARPAPLPAARYAVAMQGRDATVTYSEQCLAADLCFTWERWSAAIQAARRGSRRPPPE